MASHTGSLAGSREIWDTLCQQEGVIQVHNLEEMFDTILAFSHLKPPRGRRAGIIGIGGGKSVQAADECENANLIVLPIPQEMKKELRKFTPRAGSGLRNPIDIPSEVYWDPALLSVTIDLVASYDGVDVILILISL